MQSLVLQKWMAVVVQTPVLNMKDYRARDIFIKTGLNCKTMVVWCTESSSWWAEVTENAPHSLICFTAFILDYSDGISICCDLFRVLLPPLCCKGNVLAETNVFCNVTFVARFVCFYKAFGKTTQWTQTALADASVV